MNKLPLQVVVFLALTLLGTSAGAQASGIRFARVSIEEGLSQSTVNDITQDSSGLMWLATEEGLNVYNGYDMKTFVHQAGDPNSLIHNQVWSLLTGQTGEIWVGSSGGLSRYQPDSETFLNYNVSTGGTPSEVGKTTVRTILELSDKELLIGTDGQGIFRFDTTDETFSPWPERQQLSSKLSESSIYDKRVRSLVRAHNGDIWVGTPGDGLFRIQSDHSEVAHFVHDEADPTSLSSDNIRALHQDKEGQLWVATYGAGLNRFIESTDSFSRDIHSQKSGSLSSNDITTIYSDRTGTLWVGTQGGLNERTERGFRHYRHQNTDPRSLSSDYVLSIYQDAGGVIWVGTLGGGLNRWNPTNGFFQHYQVDPNADSTLSGSSVWALHEQGQDLWIGTLGGGLNRLNRKTGTYTHFPHDKDDPASLSEDGVGSLLVDGSGTLWVGTFTSGLNRLKDNGKSFDRWQHDPTDSSSLASNRVIALHEDPDRNLWIGLFGGGVDRFDQHTGVFQHHQHDPEDPSSLSSNRVTALLSASSGALWVGTHDAGLNRLAPGSDKFVRYGATPEEASGLASERVWSLFEDQAGDLWIGTGLGGLHVWRRDARRKGLVTFERFGRSRGLNSEAIYGILPDQEDHLWVSTNKGIYRFDKSTGTFRGFSLDNGLQSTEFNFGAHHRSTTGELFFGGINGFNAFNPSDVAGNQYLPPVLLTSFYRNGEKQRLPSAGVVGPIQLGHTDQVVSFDFAALDYTSPKENRYAYKLEGFDEDWIELGTLRRATFTNLPAGQFTLRVKAANNDGLWAEHALSLPIQVTPPPWKTWWAYSLYSLLVLGVFLSYALQQRTRNLRNERYSRELEEKVQQRTVDLAERNLDLEDVNRKLENASVTDALTGLRNRHFLLTHLKAELDEAAIHYPIAEFVSSESCPGPAAGGRHHTVQDFLVMMVDLDGFKPLNDTYGHAAGDAALIQVGQLLNEACRDTDTIVRWGGDEFMVLARRVKRNEAPHLAERILKGVLEHKFDVGDGQTANLGCSIGCALYPFVPDSSMVLSFEDTMKVADRALYYAKENGRGGWTHLAATETTPHAGLTRLISEDLDQAVVEGHIRLDHSKTETSNVVPLREAALTA